MSGLTAEEAREAAGLDLRTCYWKRCSELRAYGFIADTGERRPGGTDMDQMVSAITPLGIAKARSLRLGGVVVMDLIPAARSGDPETSHRAARSVRRRIRATSQTARLLLAYYDRAGEW